MARPMGVMRVDLAPRCAAATIGAPRCGRIHSGMRSCSPHVAPRPLDAHNRQGKRHHGRWDAIMARAYDGRFAIGDDLLDFLEAGPKMRKWYGAPERDLEAQDENKERPPKGNREPEEPEESGPRDKVLVIDANSTIGEELILQLILSKTKTKALVSNTETASKAFGPYVECVSSSVNDKNALRSMMKGVRAVIVTGDLGPMSGKLLFEACAESQIEHILLLSTFAKKSGIFANLFNPDQSALEDVSREESIEKCNIPYTIVRGGTLEKKAGRSPVLQVKQGRNMTSGTLSRSDLAFACVSALQHIPKDGMVLEVIGSNEPNENSSAYNITSREDWSPVFD